MADEDPFEFDGFDETPDLDEHESALIRQDLRDLKRFEDAFADEGFRGVSVFCRDCEEEHYYPWEMLRENLRVLLDTGETPVHEPAFQPDPEDYVPWEYARGYVDALTDAGVHARRDVAGCPRCRFELPPEQSGANFCPRCGTPLLHERLRKALVERGVEEEAIDAILRETGLPG